MATQSRIEWTERTWNPVIGCTKVSAGCKHCYAEVMARRLQAMGVPEYRDGFKVRLLPQRLQEPMTRVAPTVYFVNSMSDLFHEDVPDSYIDRVFDVMGSVPQHRFQVLTKRAQRMADYVQASGRALPGNVWMGVTVDDRRHGLARLALLQTVPAAVRFLSCEPLLEDLGPLDLSGIHWMIVGGESGHGARPMRPEWAHRLREQAEAAGVAYFFKQWGAWGEDGIRRSKKANGRALDGRVYNAMPDGSAPALA